MAAKTSGIYGSNRADFGVSNRGEKLQISDFRVPEQYLMLVLDHARNGGTLVCIST
jgi:hypothetical protein